MNPVIYRNIESVNYTADSFENGSNGKSTQGVPIEAYLRLNSIQNQRRDKDEHESTWIRRNKHMIKLKSIMNRNVVKNGRSQTPELEVDDLMVRSREYLLDQKSHESKESSRGDSYSP